MLVDILAMIAEKWVSSSPKILNFKEKTSSEHCNAILNNNSFLFFSSFHQQSPICNSMF